MIDAGKPPLTQEISCAARGALLLARPDPAAMGWFNLTEAGFWRSFLALPLVYPAFLVMALCERNLLPAAPAAGPYLAGESIAYFLQGIAFPLVMVFLARFLRLSGTYVPFIIAYNWSAIWVTAVLLPPLVLLSSGLLGTAVGGLLNLLASIASVYYRWTVTRVSLATTGFTALALMVIDMVLSIAIALAARHFYAMPVV